MILKIVIISLALVLFVGVLIDDYISVYMHMLTSNVKVGDKVVVFWGKHKNYNFLHLKY